MKSRSADLAAVTLLLIAIAVTLWIRLWRQPGLGDWDVMTQYLPWYAYLGDHVRHLDVPGWNPRLFSGSPFAANPQSGWSYLPSMLIFAFFSPMTAFRVFIGFHMVLGGLTTFAFARILKIGVIGSLAAAVVFTFGQNLGASTCCTIHVQLDAWIPLALIGVELAARATRWHVRFFWLTVAAIAVSQMIAGWVGQGTYYALLLISAYAIFRAFMLSGPWLGRLGRLAVDGCSIVLGGAALSAAGLLPRLEFAARTYVGTSAYQSQIIEPNKDWGWSALLQTLVIYEFQWRPYYQGAAVVVCVAVALVTLRRSSTVLFFAIFAAVVLILPMKLTPVHTLFYLLPRFRALHLHDPGRVLAILPIGMAIVAAAGVEALAQVFIGRTRRVVAAAPGVAWALLLVNRPSYAEDVTLTTWAVFLVAWMLVLSAVIWAPITVRNKSLSLHRATRIAQFGLILLIFLDPTGAALIRAIPRPNDVEATYAEVDSSRVLSTQTAGTDFGGAGAFLQARMAVEGTFRYFGYLAPPFDDLEWQAHERYMEAGVLPLLANNRAMSLELEDVQGYDPAHLTIYRDYFTKLNGVERDYHEELVYATGLDSPLLNLLNVRYAVAPVASKAFDSRWWTEVFRNEDVKVLENRRALPRAWIVHDVRQSGSFAESLDLLDQPTTDPAVTAVINVAPAVTGQPSAGAAEKATVVAGSDDDHVRIEVHAKAAGMLILGDVYDAGWSVYVDGKRSTLFQTDAILRGVMVSAGDHSVEFRYDPESLRAGIIISSLAAIAALLIAGWALIGWLRDPIRSQNRSIRDTNRAIN